MPAAATTTVTPSSAATTNSGTVEHTTNLGTIRSDVAVSVFMPDGFPLERVVLHPAQNSTNAQLVTRILEDIPDGVPEPDMLAPSPLVFELSVETAEGDLALTAVILHFTIEKEWLDESCPPASCAVAVLHWTGTEWETLWPQRHEDRSDGTVAFAVVARSLSPFVVAAVPPPAGAGFPPVEDDGGQVLDLRDPIPTSGLVWPVLFFLGGLLIVVAILLVRQARRRPPTETEQAPLPPPQLDPPAAGRRIAEADTETMFGRMDSASDPVPTVPKS